MRAALRRVKSERGQTLILFVGVITVVFVMAAAVIDVGLWLAERREVQRAADLAAAAGAQDLLVNDGNAVNAAYEWAGRNGYVNGAAGVTVSAELLCYNTTGAPPSAICSGTGSATHCEIGQHCDSIRVEISKPSTMLFSSIFGISSFDIEASSSAGLTVQSAPTDTVILLDASSSMAISPCATPVYDEPGCPIKEAKDASHLLTNILFGGLNTASRVGYAAYNFCYYPDFNNGQCITSANLVAPTNSVSAVTTAIDLTPSTQDGAGNPVGGTNICLALDRAYSLVQSSGSGAGAKRNIILLTDGDNNFSYGGSTTYPPSQCRAGPTPSQGCAGPYDTRPSGPGERQMDVKTLQRSQVLKTAAVEIYVVGLQVCGFQNNQIPNCGAVGNVDADPIADRRLLKCIASSPAHYVEISTASQIPDAFREIAAAIVSRGLLE